MRSVARFRLLLLLLLAAACSGRDKAAASAGVDADLIRQIVDSTFASGPGGYREPCLLDPGPLDSCCAAPLRDFLAASGLRRTDLDSLSRTDSTWLTYGFFHTAVIRVERIREETAGVYVVETQYCKASDGSHGRRMVFRKSGAGWICTESRITWIS